MGGVVQLVEQWPFEAIRCWFKSNPSSSFNARVAEMVDARDLWKLSAWKEISNVELFKFGETLTDNADGNPGSQAHNYVKV